MKYQSIVKFEGLKNPTKLQKDLQNADLSMPTEEKRLENLEKTKIDLGFQVSKKTENAFVSLNNNSIQILI